MKNELSEDEKKVLKMILSNFYNTVELFEHNGYDITNWGEVPIDTNIIFYIAEKLDCEL